MSKGVTVKDVPAAEFIKAYAEHLKRSNWLELPHWVDIVKTAKFKELCPQDPDWYFVRAASMARKLYLRGGAGIGGFTKVYGGSHRRGPRPCKFERGSGKIARHIVQQLVRIGVVENNPRVNRNGLSQTHGRRISQDGQKDLDTIAGRVAASLKPATATATATATAPKPLDLSLRAQIGVCRQLFERAVHCHFRPKTMKMLFKRFLKFEKEFGNEQTVGAVREKVNHYVNSVPAVAPVTAPTPLVRSK